MRWARAARHEAIAALLRPRSIALLGVSATRNASGNQALTNLHAAGYSGDIHLVHPVAESVAGLATVPTIQDLPGPVDVALVSLPAAAVPDALLALEQQGCRSAVVPSVGLDAEGRQAFTEIRARASMAVHGPNCFGLLNRGCPEFRGTSVAVR